MVSAVKKGKGIRRDVAEQEDAVGHHGVIPTWIQLKHIEFNRTCTR